MTTEEFKRRLTAIMSADVEGYSRLMRDDEDETIRTITSYRKGVTKLVQQYRGRVVDSHGDSLLAEFTSVADAVNCAVEIQRELSERNAHLPENRRMQFRIGVNSGDVVEKGKRIYGDGVNIAARIESLAEGGGVWISGTVYDSIEGKLGLDFEYLGEREVKNIDKPIRVFRVLSLAGAAAQESLKPASVDKMAFPLPEKPSFAVLPFVNMSGDRGQEYLADGISENIITALSKTPRMFVIARNSTFVYKGKPVKIQKVAEELGVRYVLEGSVQKSGDRLRITAQLIDAIAGHHLWAERYDRELKDIFEIQDEITIQILTAIQVQLTEGEQATLRLKGARNLDAYLKYLQALEYNRRFNKDDNVRARKTAEEVISLDPEFQGGYGIFARVEIVDVWLNMSKSPIESLMRAIELAKKAISMEDSYDPHRVLAQVYVLFRKYDEAISEGKKALDIAPNSADAQMVLGHVLMLSDMAQEAVPILKKAIRLNPYPPSAYFHNLAFAYCNIGEYKEAISAGKRAIRVAPNDIIARCALAATYSFLGRQEEARAEVAEILKIDPTISVEKINLTSPLKNQQKQDRILEALSKAGLK